MPATSEVVSRFPFDCLRQLEWEEPVLAVLRSAANEPGIAGIFLLVASAHGYAFQHLVACHDNTGRAEAAAWSSVSNRTEEWEVEFGHDATQTLKLLKDEWVERDVTKTETRDLTRGRDVTLLIATPGEARWLRCQSPKLGGAEPDGLDQLILDIQVGPAEDHRAD